MSIGKISIDFSTSKFSDNEIGLKAMHVNEEMKNNPNFLTPEPPLTGLETTTGEFIMALKNIEDGTKEDTVIKNDRRKILENILKPLAEYVQLTSGGDEAIILSSGFDVNKKPVFVGPLAKATSLSVKVGDNRGTVVAECDVVPHASFYEFEHSEMPIILNSIWTKLTSTKRKLIINQLISGKQYSFRVAGAASDPTRIWSDEIQSFVL